MPSQYDERLPEHGYVNVTYNETLVDPPRGQAAFRPYVENEVGETSTDPKGLLMMKEDAVIDLNTPADVELWRHGDVHEAEGLDHKDVWKKDKVRC